MPKSRNRPRPTSRSRRLLAQKRAQQMRQQGVPWGLPGHSFQPRMRWAKRMIPVLEVDRVTTPEGCRTRRRLKYQRLREERQKEAAAQAYETFMAAYHAMLSADRLMVVGEMEPEGTPPDV